MKVLLVNGSPHKRGCTYTALKEVEGELKNEQIETEIMWLGIKPIGDCIACNNCIENKNECFIDDIVNKFVEQAKYADGFVFGSPVYYASPSGAIISFLDRAFYGKGKIYENKLCATVVSCRRGGASSSFDVLNKYPLMNNMYLVGSNYWNQVHGNTPEEVLKDEEGMQTMRFLGKNMAYLLKCMEIGKKSNIGKPVYEDKIKTNFIR